MKSEETIDWNKEQSHLIDVIRFPLIYIVLVIHVLPQDLKPISLSWGGMMPYTILSEIISHHFGRIAVPCFFVISGYFFFVKMQEWNIRFYCVQLQKRVKTLLVPFILWNLAFIVIPICKIVLFDYLGVKQHDSLAFYRDHNILELMWMPIDFPLWYVRDLICMTILSPMFYYCFKYIGKWGVLLLTIVYFGTYNVDFPDGFSTTSIYFFGVGAYFGIYKKNMLQFVIRYRVFAYIVFFPLLLISAINIQYPIYEILIRLFIISGLISFTSIIYKWSKNEKFAVWMINFSPYVFFIFAFHELYIKNWLKGLTYRTPLADSAIGMIIGWLLMPIAAALICIGVYHLWKKVSPRSLSVMVGGRLE